MADGRPQGARQGSHPASPRAGRTRTPSRTRPLPRRQQPGTSARLRACGACLSRVLGNGHALVLRGARHSNVPGLPVRSGNATPARVGARSLRNAEVSGAGPLARWRLAPPAGEVVVRRSDNAAMRDSASTEATVATARDWVVGGIGSHRKQALALASEQCEEPPAFPLWLYRRRGHARRCARGGCKGCAVSWRSGRARRECRAPWIWLRRSRRQELRRATIQLRLLGRRSSFRCREPRHVRAVASWP